MYQIPARKLATGDKIFDVQIEGERIQRKSSTPVVKVWKHGPCITVLTSRGQVEYDQDEPVQVNAAAHKRVSEQRSYMGVSDDLSPDNIFDTFFNGNK